MRDPGEMRSLGNNPCHLTWISQGVYLDICEYLVNIMMKPQLIQISLNIFCK